MQSTKSKHWILCVSKSQNVVRETGDADHVGILEMSNYCNFSFQSSSKNDIIMIINQHHDDQQ